MALPKRISYATPGEPVVQGGNWSSTVTEITSTVDSRMLGYDNSNYHPVITDSIGRVLLSPSSTVNVDADIQIGAVEIKDEATNNRLNVIDRDSPVGSTVAGIVFLGHASPSSTVQSGDAIPFYTDVYGRVIVSPSSTVYITPSGTQDVNVLNTNLNVTTSASSTVNAVQSGNWTSTVSGTVAATQSGGWSSTVSGLVLDSGGRVKRHTTILREIDSQNLVTSTLSHTSTFGTDLKLLSIMLHASVAITETITVTFDSGDGANYDTVLATTNLTADTDYLYQPSSDFYIESTDAINVHCTNTGTIGTVYATILAEDLTP